MNPENAVGKLLLHTRQKFVAVIKEHAEVLS